MIEILVRIDAEAGLHRCGRMRFGKRGVGDRAPLPGSCRARAQRLGRGREQAGKLLREAGRRVPKQHAILRALRPGHAGLNGCQVQLQRLRVFGLRRASRVEQSLLLVVGLDQGNLLLASAGQAQVAQRFGVHRKDAAGCAVLGSHIADRRAVGQSQLSHTGPKELDELAYHA